MLISVLVGLLVGYWCWLLLKRNTSTHIKIPDVGDIDLSIFQFVSDSDLLSATATQSSHL